MMNNIAKNIHIIMMELADLHLQRKLWLNEKNDTGLISSYTELMCSLFDDYSFDDFVEVNALKIGLSKSLIFELSKLRELLNKYDERKSDEEIINDTEWGKIVEQAKIVIKAWDREKG